MIQLQKISILNLFVLVFSMLLFTQCEKDEDTTVSGRVTFEMTDAPIDNAEVQGAFVTVAELKVDGQSIDLNGKQTIDVLAYQNGDTKSLGIAELEAGTYSNVTLVLDYAQDADGNSPGCYILTTDNQKIDLQAEGSSSNEITFDANALQVEGDGESTLVMDFDLRKAIKANDNNAPSRYSFVSDSELRASLRSVIKAEAGRMEGNCANANDYGDRVVVYAYKKGTYNSSTEMEGQGSSNVEFFNAVTSATVNANGDFSLHFLEEGEYEVHFIAYEEDNDGNLEIAGTLQTSVIGSIILDLLSLEVEANASLTFNLSATGIIPF